MKKILLLTGLFYCLLSYSQDETVKKLRSDSEKNIKKDPNDTTNKTWKVGGMYSLNLSQGSLSNWAAGGEKFSIAVNSLLSSFRTSS